MAPDLTVREHFKSLRREALKRVRDQRQRDYAAAAREKRLRNQQRLEEIHKITRVILGDVTINQVAVAARLPRSTVWRALMGRFQPRVTQYLRIARAIQKLNHTPRALIDRYLMRVLRKPLA